MTDALDATGLPSMPLEIERLKRSKTWRRCRTEPFLAYYVANLWMAAFHGVPAGSLEDDDELLAELAGCLPLEWVRVRPIALHAWQKREDGRLYHPIVEAKAREALSIRSAAKRIVRPLAEQPKAVLDLFESWYAEYPRKVAKGAARIAYGHALKKCGADVLLEAAKSYARKVSLSDHNFLPYPGTWLNNERWLEIKFPRLSEKRVDLSGSWNGRASRLQAEIGEHAFREWFGSAELVEGSPLVIRLPKTFQRDWIEGHFAGPLRRAVGDFRLEVGKQQV
jgi:hypothetical protein